MTTTVRRPYLWAIVLAAAFATLTVLVAVVADLPLRDPDGIGGPAGIRLPALVALLFCLDVVPRAVARARRGGGGTLRALREVIGERWALRRAAVVLVGLVSFYVTYVAYRNLKSFLPMLTSDLHDRSLLEFERVAALGSDPATILHQILGTGVAAYALSLVYLFFLIFVPVSLAAALVWSRDLRLGYWYVTALGVNWVLGTAVYFLMPAMGPIFAEPTLFTALPETGVSQLQSTLLAERAEVLAGPWATEAVHGIAAFPSLHVSITFTAAAIASLVGLPRWVTSSLWAFVGLTALATIYFGWHYVVDDIAGVAIGAVAVWAGALATGHDVNAAVRRQLARPAHSTARLT
ncbi:MAG: phosphatase PAP2 family protein [Solirubrobacteraceae bacterium MAG38_C4-C5]|nr:phosphatase PAP2 family protein [Candidatus Siliceabacter maunaloa]